MNIPVHRFNYILTCQQIDKLARAQLFHQSNMFSVLFRIQILDSGNIGTVWSLWNILNFNLYNFLIVSLQRLALR